MIMGFTDLKLRSWVCGFNLEVSKSILRRLWFNYYFFKIILYQTKKIKKSESIHQIYN